MARVPKSVSREKEKRVVNIIVTGGTFQDVVDAGIYSSTSGAYEAYSRAILRDTVKDVEQIRSTEVKRIDMMLRAWFPRALGVNGHDADDKAAGIVMKLMEQRRKYIGGLEAPQQINVEHKDVTRDEFSTFLAGAHEEWKRQQESNTKADA